jgi:hypothetical protein
MQAVEPLYPQRKVHAVNINTAIKVCQRHIVESGGSDFTSGS